MPIDEMRDQIDVIIGSSEAAPPGTAILSLKSQTVLDAAESEAGSDGHAHVGADDVLVGLIARGGVGVRAIFGRYGIDVDSVRRRVDAFLWRDPAPDGGRESLSTASPADSPELADLIRQLADVREAKMQKIDEGMDEAALRLRTTEKKLLRDIKQMRTPVNAGSERDSGETQHSDHPRYLPSATAAPKGRG